MDAQDQNSAISKHLEILRSFWNAVAGGEAEGLRALLKDMLRSSSHLLPLAQRSLVLHDPSHLPALSLSSDNLRRLDQPGISLAAALDVPTGEVLRLRPPPRAQVRSKPRI